MVSIETLQDPSTTVERIGVFTIVRRHQHESCLGHETATVSILIAEHHLGELRSNLLGPIILWRDFTCPRPLARLRNWMPFNLIDVVEFRSDHYEIRVDETGQSQVAREHFPKKFNRLFLDLLTNQIKFINRENTQVGLDTLQLFQIEPLVNKIVDKFFEYLFHENVS